jgi:hypothetical protein
MKNLSRHTDLLCELETSLLMRGIQIGEMSKLGWDPVSETSCNPLPTHETETDPVSETSCFLVPRIPNDGKSKKFSNSECDTQSSIFMIHFNIILPLCIFQIVSSFRFFD